MHVMSHTPAHGRLSVEWSDYAIGSHRVTCPHCGRGPRDKTLGVTVDAGGSGVAHCFRCEFTESYHPLDGSHISTHGNAPIRAATPVKYQTLSDYGRDLWSASKPLSGIATDYLTARRCVIPPADGALRWHPALTHPCGHVGPALVAMITDAVTREPISLHRTWVNADGTKADIESPRLLLGGHRKSGGCIRLWNDETVTYGLAVAEGIESALSLAIVYKPAWALIDASNMRTFAPLPGIESLFIAADNDPAGERAAEECGESWVRADRDVRIFTYRGEAHGNTGSE